MSVVVPTVTAYDLHEYRQQIELVSRFAKRIHLDLMDGQFAPVHSPDIDRLWVPHGVQVDVHLMFQHPSRVIKKVLALAPSLIIMQAEANQDSVKQAIEGLKKTKTKVGVSLLADTEVNSKCAQWAIAQADYVLVFSGHLGYHGGVADLNLLSKVKQIHLINSVCEIGWDGGITTDNALHLRNGGIDVLNVGSAIHRSADPEKAYQTLRSLVQ